MPQWAYVNTGGFSGLRRQCQGAGEGLDVCIISAFVDSF